MTKKKTHKSSHIQLEFDREKLFAKRFSLQSLATSKFNALANHMDRLTYSDVTWLSRVEDFFHQNEYLTERQIEVVDSILKRHSIEFANSVAM